MCTSTPGWGTASWRGGRRCCPRCWDFGAWVQHRGTGAGGSRLVRSAAGHCRRMERERGASTRAWRGGQRRSTCTGKCDRKATLASSRPLYMCAPRQPFLRSAFSGVRYPLVAGPTGPDLSRCQEVSRQSLAADRQCLVVSTPLAHCLFAGAWGGPWARGGHPTRNVHLMSYFFDRAIEAGIVERGSLQARSKVRSAPAPAETPPTNAAPHAATHAPCARLRSRVRTSTWRARCASATQARRSWPSWVLRTWTRPRGSSSAWTWCTSTR